MYIYGFNARLVVLDDQHLKVPGEGFARTFFNDGVIIWSLVLWNIFQTPDCYLTNKFLNIYKSLSDFEIEPEQATELREATLSNKLLN